MKNKKKRRLFVLLYAAVLVYAGYIVFQQQMYLKQMRDQKAEIMQKTNVTQQLAEQTQNEISVSDTDEYIERFAREKLGLVKRDEQVFVDTSVR